MSDDNIQHDERFDLDGGQYDALKEAAGEVDGEGPDLGFACNARPTDHLHAYRVGHTGSGLAARALVIVHDGGRNSASVFLAASQARQLAAHLLNVADDIDGATPLVFHPRAAVPASELDDPTVSADEEPAPVAAEEDPCDEFDDLVLAEPVLPTIAALVLDLATLPLSILRKRLGR